MSRAPSNMGSPAIPGTTAGTTAPSDDPTKPKPKAPIIPAGLGPDVTDKEREEWEKDWEQMETKGHAMRNFFTFAEMTDFSKYVNGYVNPPRPKDPNDTGKLVSVDINVHKIAQYPARMVHQFDITITGSEGPIKRGLLRALWESNTAKKHLGKNWIWNGDKIAWSDAGIPEQTFKKTPFANQSITIEIDLDGERDGTKAAAQQARAPHGPEKKLRTNVFKMQVRFAKTVNLAAIWGYLSKSMDYNSAVTEAITLLNHIIRENPQRNLTAFKNSFFPKNDGGDYDLGGGIYALKGAFQSIRTCQGGNLMVNVDVSHACFYKPGRVDHIAMQLVEIPRMDQLLSLVQKAQRNPPYGAYTDSQVLKKLQLYLRKLAFRVDYPGVSPKVSSRRWIIKGISYDSARTRKINYRDRTTKKETSMSVAEYFSKIYGVRLEHPALPLIECTKKDVYYPMELCLLENSQRYPFKLNERQTADMIKFAVSRPAQRKEAIAKGLKNLNWPGDSCLKHFGVNISPNMTNSKARLLQAPNVQFANNKAESPGTAGRWRIDGKKFHGINKKPLKHWSVCIIESGRGRDGCTDQEAMAFIKQLVALYKGYGGDVVNPQPATCKASEADTAAAVDISYAAMRKKGLGDREYADLMVFILPRKNTENYQRLKRCADLKWGSVSQCVQAAHVKKNSDQYIGNVLMKINAKLGGHSFKAMPIASKTAPNGKYFKIPTMIIGADISHPAPGSLQASMAAITVSMDKDAIRYGAAVQSNGHRLEMITTWNWNEMLGPIASEWMAKIGGGRIPQHVYYFRDGVSEGQYEHVIQQEVRDIRGVFKGLTQSQSGDDLAKLKFTVIIASKRHHIRFFPKPGPGADKNGNACPGTLVENDVTGVKSFDFYLSSHSAIQGTARPTHYSVIMDQAGCTANGLQNMIYEHCYQYMRSSTPVSLYPAVYYAHLASRRAVAHERTGKQFAGHRSSEQKERYMLLRARAEADITGKVMTEQALAKLKEYTTNEYPPCIPTCNTNLWHGMWYI